APNSASAPCAPPLKRMASARATMPLLLVLAVVGFRFHEIRQRVDGLVFLLLVHLIEIVHTAGELRRDGTAWTVLILLESRLGALLPIGWCGWTEVLRARRRRAGGRRTRRRRDRRDAVPRSRCQAHRGRRVVDRRTLRRRCTLRDAVPWMGRDLREHGPR